jgi:hypothetical protein
MYDVLPSSTIVSDYELGAANQNVQIRACTLTKWYIKSYQCKWRSHTPHYSCVLTCFREDLHNRNTQLEVHGFLAIGTTGSEASMIT